MDKMSGKILFLHGLEAGLNGNKSLYLRKVFKNNCITPDFQVSKFKFWLKNSFILNILKNWKFLSISLLIFLIILLTSILTKYFYIALSLGIFLYIVFIFLIRKDLIREAVSKSFENNIKTAENEIKKHNPEIIISSSWGGAVLIALIERGIWKGNSLLIAPAFYSVNKVILKDKEKAYDFKFNKIKEFNGKIIVYHSKKDEIIPYKDSLFLCEKHENDENSRDISVNKENKKDKNLFSFSNYELKSYEKGLHDMLELIDENENILKNDILSLMKGGNYNDRENNNNNAENEVMFLNK